MPRVLFAVLVRGPIRKGSGNCLVNKNGFELYDGKEEVGETRNLVRERPELVRELLADNQKLEGR